MAENLFLGKPIPYWIELEKKAENLNVAHLIQEIADLYAKVGFYEKRLGEMADFMSVNK